MPQPVADNIPDANLIGGGKFTYLFWDVYNAQLHAATTSWQGRPPYALSLTYLRDFKGEDIAKRSAKEIKEQGIEDENQLEDWLVLMTNLFPDVNEGETLTGIFREDRTTVFYRGEELIGVVEDVRFGERFFGIWLSEKTSEPKLRKLLIGEK